MKIKTPQQAGRQAGRQTREQSTVGKKIRQDREGLGWMDGWMDGGLRNRKTERQLLRPERTIPHTSLLSVQTPFFIFIFFSFLSGMHFTS